MTETCGNMKIRFWERVYCDVNSFKWRIFPNFLKPNGWENMSGCSQYKNKIHRFVYKLSKLLTTKKGRSRAHWLLKLKRTESQWLYWWENKRESDQRRMGIK